MVSQNSVIMLKAHQRNPILKRQTLGITLTTFSEWLRCGIAERRQPSETRGRLRLPVNFQRDEKTIVANRQKIAIWHHDQP
jgi:hypothetical protein